MLENNYQGQMEEQHLTDNTAGLQILFKETGQRLLKYMSGYQMQIEEKNNLPCNPAEIDTLLNTGMPGKYIFQINIYGVSIRVVIRILPSDIRE